MTDAATAESATLELPAADADALSDIEITIEGEAAATPAAAKEVSTDTGIDELRKQLRDYDARAKAAERQRDDAQNQLSHVSRQAVEANLGTIVSSIETATNAAKTAKADWQRFMEAGDYAKAGDAQEVQVAAQANLLRLQERKAELESGRGQVQQPRQPVSKIEQMAAQLSAPSAAWLRAHPDVADRFDQAEAAHNYITKIKGVTVDTPEYFQRIEEELGIRAAAKKEDPEVVPPKPAPKLQGQAPVTQSAPSLRTGQPERQVVTLTAAEREIAHENKMTDREYAIEKMAAIKAGQIKG